MDMNYTDIQDGMRHDITVEVITQRTVDCGSCQVTRLLVADPAGEQFSILVTADSDAARDLKTGAAHHVSELLGAFPVLHTAATSKECPNCGSELRSGQTVDAAGTAVSEAAAALDIDEPFGIVDAKSTIRRGAGNGDRVDDWVAMDTDTQVDPPDYVCESCGCHVDNSQLRDDRPPADESVKTVESKAAPAQVNQSPASPESVGLATGGAKDIANFRENIDRGYTPQPEAISDEGLFYDYYFETGAPTETDALFAPRYAAARSDHPLTGETEQYLSVGLDSTLSVSEFERPRLDLVAVLDVSGSMNSAFDEYYYDEHGRKHEVESEESTKLEAAIQSLCALTEQLRADDRLGVVLFNNRAHVAKPLRDVATTDMPAIRGHIRDISANGGTNMADGFEAAVDMLLDEAPEKAVERRVVFLTDMMPNTGQTGEGDLTELFTDVAAEGIHTTFIGMGLDANAELADALSGIRGANHYFVHSAAEFERRLGEEFDYMVTPLVYDLELEIEADGYEIEAVHGSPADGDSDQIVHVETLFPSAKEDGEAKGGVMLVRLSQTSQDADLSLIASWTERDGSEYTEQVSVDIPAEEETFAHDGVQKAVALARYARELRSWASDVHERANKATGVDDWLIQDGPGKHERQSVSLVVPNEYADRFEQLREYLADEHAQLQDDTLTQELELLDTLCDEAPARQTEVVD